ncbi:hypothetical protein AYK26_00645 [Euryarchaeota archaeon SM23-78]|nr:MAG: hypothetical protein AYK26_00645 [Euryarchaeota archaeon SM23-78]
MKKFLDFLSENPLMGFVLIGGCVLIVAIIVGFLTGHADAVLGLLNESPQVKTAAVEGIGTDATETFVVVNGVKYYSHVDGESIEDHFRDR